MNPAIHKILESIEEQSSHEWPYPGGMLVGESKVDGMLLPVGRESGRFLSFMVRALKCRHILDLGAGVGYSTLWLADAARDTGGRVVAVERNLSKAAIAISHLADAALLDICEFRQCEALEFLASVPGPWDFVLLDIWKGYYIACFEALMRTLSPGAVVVADNMKSPSELTDYAIAYQSFVRGKNKTLSIEVSIGNGLELTLVNCMGGGKG